MMKEHAEPHFNDERTILSARPVVPLEKIEKKARHRRQWFLGGAFALAMMLGAASALVASYLKLRNVPQTATEVSVEEDVPPAPVAVVESTPSATPVTEEEQVAATTPPVTLSKEEPAPKHRTIAAHPNAEPVEDRDVRQPSEEEQLQQVREAVLYDQWQERRARRALRRERRRAERYNHRDLSNLDEIFEGRRRP
jgi:type IV secretory pathway VirB10-like protein